MDIYTCILIFIFLYPVYIRYMKSSAPSALFVVTYHTRVHTDQQAEIMVLGSDALLKKDYT